MHGTTGRASRGRRGLAALAIVVALAVLGVECSVIVEYGAWPDMRILFDVIDGWWSESTPLFAPASTDQFEPGRPSYRYPPLWALITVPFAVPFERTAGILVYAAFSTLLFLGGVALLGRRLGHAWLSPWMAGALLLVAVTLPFYECFYGPTKELSIFALLAASFVLGESGRRCSAGCLLALAVSFKVYPALFALYWLVRREFRVLAWTAAWGVLLNLLPLLFGAGPETRLYFLELLPRLGGTTARPENASLEQWAMTRAWSAWFDSGIEPLVLTQYDRVAIGLARLLVVAACAGLALTLERRRALDDLAGRFLLFATCAAAVLLLIPASWVNYQLYLFFPWLALLSLLPRLGARSRAVVVLLLAAAWLPVLAPVNRGLLSRYARPELDPALRIISSFNLETEPELLGRIEHRTRELERLGDRTRWGGLSARERHALLVASGVDDASSRSPELAGARTELERTHEALRKSPSPVLERELERASWRTRVHGLTNEQLLLFPIVRPGVGLLSFLAAAWGCAVLRPQRRESA